MSLLQSEDQNNVAKVLTGRRLRNRLGKSDWQSIRIETNGQLDAFAFPLRRRHDEANSFRLKLLVSFVNVVNIESD